MVVRMRHTRAHTANRRSHHALKTRQFSVCEKCTAPKMSHMACSVCGTYRGRQVIDKVKQVEKKQAKTKAVKKVKKVKKVKQVKQAK